MGPRGDAAITDLLERARGGDAVAREDLIRRYQPFVAGAASRASGRYVDRRTDDNFSVALTAFNEAIDAFDPSRGASFLAFAETVIKRRLIDLFRQSKDGREVPLSTFEVEDEEGSVQNPVDRRMATDAWQLRDEGEDRRAEIAAFVDRLGAFGLSLAELAANSPKHRDAREAAQAAARALATRPDLMAFTEEKGRLPLKELSEIVPVSRKTLERQRKYILGVALILTGDFAHLKEYIP